MLEIGGLRGGARAVTAREDEVLIAPGAGCGPASVKRISASTSAERDAFARFQALSRARAGSPPRARGPRPFDRDQIAAHVDPHIQLLLEAREMLACGPPKRAQQRVALEFQRG